ncbi:MAG: hypothetical protein JWR68_720 [Polaromonas sp.]|nr:hypothetical protein [Polaromonas sp.]
MNEINIFLISHAYDNLLFYLFTVYLVFQYAKYFFYSDCTGIGAGI